MIGRWAGVFATLVVVVGVLTWLLVDRFRRLDEDQAADETEVVASMLADRLAGADWPGAAERTLVRALAGSPLTATAFDRSGREVARSPRGSGRPDPVGIPKELEEARLASDGIGRTRRGVRAAEIATAWPIERSGRRLGWVWVARSQEGAWFATRAAYRGAALIGGLGLLVLVVVAAVVETRWSRAVRALERGVQALGQGQSIGPALLWSGGPVRRLARAFGAVAPRLEERIDRLEQDRQQLRAVLSGMAEGVMAVDARRRLLFANPSADRLFGLDAGAVGRLVPELIRSPQVQEVVEATLSGPNFYRGEIALASQEELPRVQARILAVQGTPLPGSPPPGAVLVFHDITELRRLERMRQDFVANASHELKTPLAAIRAYTETLLDWALHDDAVNERFLRQIDEQADRLHQLVLDLLSLARLESGQEVYVHEPLAIAPAVRACAEGHRARAEAQGLQFLLETEPLDGAARVCADEEALRQILDNLIDNAIKYTPAGGWVRVSCRVGHDHRVVLLDVADSGVGIPRDHLPRIFERFYRVDQARSREVGGTGLGLSIVKHLVQALGGQITVASRVGSGTRFSIRLPRCD